MPQYLEFVICAKPKGSRRKTEIWAVESVIGNVPLGDVAWYSNWRKYCFFPLGKTVFDPNCLDEIRKFCEQQTVLWRESKIAP